MHKRLFTNSTGFVKYTTNKSRFMTGKKKKKKEFIEVSHACHGYFLANHISTLHVFIKL